jgi:hypothetical protein
LHAVIHAEREAASAAPGADGDGRTAASPLGPDPASLPHGELLSRAEAAAAALAKERRRNAELVHRLQQLHGEQARRGQAPEGPLRALRAGRPAPPARISLAVPSPHQLGRLASSLGPRGAPRQVDVLELQRRYGELQEAHVEQASGVGINHRQGGQGWAGRAGRAGLQLQGRAPNREGGTKRGRRASARARPFQGGPPWHGRRHPSSAAPQAMASVGFGGPRPP